MHLPSLAYHKLVHIMWLMTDLSMIHLQIPVCTSFVLMAKGLHYTAKTEYRFSSSGRLSVADVTLMSNYDI